VRRDQVLRDALVREVEDRHVDALARVADEAPHAPRDGPVLRREVHLELGVPDARGHGRAAALLLVIAPVHVHLLELLGVPSGHAL
jgi:hypothetical protein